MERAEFCFGKGDRLTPIVFASDIKLSIFSCPTRRANSDDKFATFRIQHVGYNHPRARSRKHLCFSGALPTAGASDEYGFIVEVVLHDHSPR